MISNIIAANGKKYTIGKLAQVHYQYEDRPYQFDYVPRELNCTDHIKTHGNDKMFSEYKKCFSFIEKLTIAVTTTNK